MNVVHPANVVKFFNIMIPIVMFDFLADVPLFQDYISKFENDDQDLSRLSDQVVDLGYDSYNPLVNMRTSAVFHLLYFIRVAFLFGVLYPLVRYLAPGKFKNYCKQKFKDLKSTLVFSEILTIYFGSLIELLLSSALFTSVPKKSSVNTSLNKIISIYFALIPIILIPFIFFWMFTKRLTQIKSVTF